MHDIWHANEILLTTAREYGSSNATGGDVTVAAYRLAATKLREHSMKEFERAAEQAEKTS